MLWYDFVKNEKTSLTGYTGDIKDNVFISASIQVLININCTRFLKKRANFSGFNIRVILRVTFA